MTQLLTPARRVRVTVDAQGRPQQVTSAGAVRRVTQICNRWRVDLDWWRKPVARDYWKVVLDDDVLCEFFHDLEDHVWFLERIYD
jgi:hypothetical protein